MKRWKSGVAALLTSLPLWAGAQSQTKVWDVENVNAPQNYMSNVTIEQAASVMNEPALQMNFGGLWAQVGQTYAAPVNWSNYSGFSVAVQNLENREVSFGIRFDRNAAYNDYVSSAFVLRAGETRRFYLDLSGFNPRDFGMVLPMPAMDSYYTQVLPFQSGKTLGSVYRWSVYSRDNAPMRVRVASIFGQNANLSVNGLVDRFGQYSRRTWAGKVQTPQDLVNQRADEVAELAANPGTGETFGSNTLPTTPFTGKWRAVKTQSGKAYFLTPEGKYFWSLGITSVNTEAATITQGRTQMFTGLPTQGDARQAFYGSVVRSGVTKQTFDHYKSNLSEKFGALWPTEWMDTARRRLTSWGMNTLGAGSDLSNLNRIDMPAVYALDTNAFPVRLSTPNAYWTTMPDVFTSNFVPWIQARFTTALRYIKTDPRLMGVYVDGEHVWGMRNGSLRDRYELPLAALKSPITQPAKGAFVSRLTAKYGTIAALNTRWGTSFASWDALKNATPTLTDPQVEAAQLDLSNFLLDFAKAYYYRVKVALKAVAPDLLYLGARDCYAWAPDEVFKGAGYYVDVISIDHYDDADHTPWDYFQTLTKPVMIAEFSFNGRDFNAFPNLTLPGCERENQTARALAARQYLDKALATKNIIGAHWYRYLDLPTAGKSEHDQNFSFGLVDVTDKPYAAMVNMFRIYTSNMYARRGL